MFDFENRPFLVIWETTHACDLACRHCRAMATPIPESGELNTIEAKKLIQDVADLKTPIFIFSGGDPLKRADLPELIRFAKSFGMKTGAIPAVSENLNPDKLKMLKDAGLDQVAFSLDAPTAKMHDDFRGIPGIFDRTLRAVEWAKEAGLAVQINSLINTHNFDVLDEQIRLVSSLGIVFWEVFFLVPMGRGQNLSILSPEQFEAAFEKIYAVSQKENFIVKVTEGQHFRRYCAEREDGADQLYKKGHPSKISQASFGVNSGKGFLFVSCKGEIFPSGFLPIGCGDIRTHSLGEIYRNHPILWNLRNKSYLKGRCGACEYNDFCGGSRSRAFAMTGDYLAEDPCCNYEPQALRQKRQLQKA